MNRAFVGALLYIFLFTGGCGTTVSNLRESGNKMVFVADENYQSVYRKILYKSRECFQAGAIGFVVNVQGDIFQDIKSAHVNVAVVGSYVINTLDIDILYISDNTSKVETYYKHWTHNAVAIEKWVKEDYKECEVYSKEEPIDERTKGRLDAM